MLECGVSSVEQVSSRGFCTRPQPGPHASSCPDPFLFALHLQPIPTPLTQHPVVPASR